MPEITLLPPDQFNVVVNNDMDRLRLLWLANKIGEVKLRKSVGKYQARYPDCKPFVSTLLKWYNLKVPVAVYAPKAVPVYWLYLLCLRNSPKVKIGMTARWPHRAYDFLPRAIDYFPKYHEIWNLFEPDRSVAFLVGGSKKEALRRERLAKELFAESSIDSPWPDGMIPYGAGGHKEWFDARIQEDFLKLASSFDPNGTIQSLRSALGIIEQFGDSTAPALVLATMINDLYNT